MDDNAGKFLCAGTVNRIEIWYLNRLMFGVLFGFVHCVYAFLTFSVLCQDRRFCIQCEYIYQNKA